MHLSYTALVDFLRLLLFRVVMASFNGLFRLCFLYGCARAGPVAMFDPDSDAHLQIVKQQALQRLDPF